jgi:hypothetical protein
MVCPLAVLFVSLAHMLHTVTQAVPARVASDRMLLSSPTLSSKAFHSTLSNRTACTMAIMVTRPSIKPRTARPSPSPSFSSFSPMSYCPRACSPHQQVKPTLCLPPHLIQVLWISLPTSTPIGQSRFCFCVFASTLILALQGYDGLYERAFLARRKIHLRQC